MSSGGSRYSSGHRRGSSRRHSQWIDDEEEEEEQFEVAPRAHTRSATLPARPVSLLSSSGNPLHLQHSLHRSMPPITPFSAYENEPEMGNFTPIPLHRAAIAREAPYRSDNLIVVLMGVTGSGKSSFASLLADQPVEISHALHSDTINVNPYSFVDDYGRTIYLVDTPGFEDTSRSDAEVLKDIAFFLASSYANGVPLAGIIYLHRISDARMSGSALKNLRMFQGLCGSQNYRHVVLATTMWSEMRTSSDRYELAVQRQGELEGTYWKDMISADAHVRRHDGSPASALDIVRILTRDPAQATPISSAPSTGLSPGPNSRRRPTTNAVAGGRGGVVLAIQHQLVDQHRTLDETDAGRVVFEDFTAARRRFELQVDDLRQSLLEAERERDQRSQDEIRAEWEAVEAQAERRARDWEALRVGVEDLAEEQRPQYRTALESLASHGEGIDARGESSRGVNARSAAGESRGFATAGLAADPISPDGSSKTADKLARETKLRELEKAVSEREAENERLERRLEQQTLAGEELRDKLRRAEGEMRKLNRKHSQPVKVERRKMEEEKPQNPIAWLFDRILGAPRDTTKMVLVRSSTGGSVASRPTSLHEEPSQGREFWSTR